MINKNLYYESLIEKNTRILNSITDEKLGNTLKAEIRFLKNKC